jgi:hypothetical protein
VVGLLSEHSEVPAICSDLAAAGVDVGAVEILCGERGARILDADGRYHGLRGRIVRTLQGSSSSPSSTRTDPGLQGVVVILLGLELLAAGGIVRTVATSPSLMPGSQRGVR